MVTTGSLKYPGAIWKPYTTQKSTTKLVHDIICLHTMVGTFNGSWSWANQSGNPYWHFGLSHDALYQCWGLEYKTAANLNGNWHVIPIETADRNEGVWPLEYAPRLWTGRQVDLIVNLVAWLCIRFNIPPVMIPDTVPGRRGIAYHRQGVNPWRVPNGELWSRANGKVCPDDPRIGQLRTIVIPRVQALVNNTNDNNGNSSQEDDVPYYAYITGPGKPPRVYVDGALVGFPNTTELQEFLAPWKAAGYVQKNIPFAEADDWDRYMVSTTAGRLASLTAADIDEAAIVTGVLAGLSPEAIAKAVMEALPENQARLVVEEIGRQLAP